MDFKEYIYNEIGKRIKNDRENWGVTQDGYVTRINLDYSADPKKEKSTRLTRERLSSIENGKKQKERNFLFDSEIKIFTKCRFPSRLELLLGTDEEMKKTLKSLFFVCLINGHKLDKIETEYQLFDISYSREIEHLSNIIIKAMLSIPEFAQKFSEIFFYRSNYIDFKTTENHNHVGKRKHHFSETTKELEIWYSENTGNLIPKLTETKQSTKVFLNTASKVLENIVELLFEEVKEKLNDTLRNLEKHELPNRFQEKTGIINRISLRDAYARGYISTDFLYLVKARGIFQKKRNKSLSVTNFQKLRTYLLNNPKDEFHILVLLALETGMRRGELLGIRPEHLFDYGIKVRESISPTSSDTSLKTENSRREVTINKEVYDLLLSVPVKENGYFFDPDGFHQSRKLAKLLEELGIPKTTFHGLRDTHASFLFSKDIDIVYVSKRLGHVNIQTTQNYYLELMPEKRHQQDADALNLLNSLSE